MRARRNLSQTRLRDVIGPQAKSKFSAQRAVSLPCVTESQRECWVGKLVLNTTVLVIFGNLAGTGASLPAAVDIRYVRLFDDMLVGSPFWEGWVGDIVLN